VNACPACGAPKASGQYLCRGCWFSLDASARRALWRKDGLALKRLGELFEQIKAGVALPDIRVSP
jgi:hypothetical protein